MTPSSTHAASSRGSVTRRSVGSRRRVRSLPVVALAAALAIVPGTLAPAARAQESADDWVIPPGQDAALRQLVAADEGLVGCSLELADAQRTEIRLEYRCGGAPFRYTLRHVGEGSCAAFCTEVFDASVVGASRPALTRALEANVRAHEGGFEFVRAATAPRGGSGFFGRAPGAVRIGIAAAVAALIAIFLRGGRREDEVDSDGAGGTAPEDTDRGG